MKAVLTTSTHPFESRTDANTSLGPSHTTHTQKKGSWLTQLRHRFLAPTSMNQTKSSRSVWLWIHRYYNIRIRICFLPRKKSAVGRVEWPPDIAHRRSQHHHTSIKPMHPTNHKADVTCKKCSQFDPTQFLCVHTQTFSPEKKPSHCTTIERIPHNDWTTPEMTSVAPPRKIQENVVGWGNNLACT